MINWEELRHIHVVRKLEEIMGSWFGTDLFFVDDKGQFVSWVPGEKRDFKNKLNFLLNNTPDGQRMLQKMTASGVEKLIKGEQSNIVTTGILGPEKCLISRIVIGNDFLGGIVAYPILESELSATDKGKIADGANHAEINAAEAEKILSQSKALKGKDMEYFRSLVDLVSQEAITFHTEISSREERISALNQELGTRYKYDNMIGKSKPMQDLYSLLDKIKSSDSTILVQGENGTGKELIAKSIHFNSPRKEKTFVTINCSAFNENLLDSELFGHVKGSFTGAVKDKKGVFEAADKGTLFLDEIGDMSLGMQVKLLRVLQEGTLTPVGATDVKKVDVRVIAATNKNLKEMTETGEFREDLYYRINVINVHVPALRDRKDDIPVLVDYFMDRKCKEKGVPLKQLAKRALEKMYDYAWPGNIRELEHEIERLVVLAGDDVKVSADLLSPRIKEQGEKSKVQGVRIQGKLKDALEELEKLMIKEGLKRTNWNKSRLAKELGISRAGLIMKVDKYGLDKRKLARAAQEAGEAEEV